MKKAATIFISAVMTLSLGVNAFAAVIDHDIDASDLEVNTLNNNEDGYRVYSSSGNKSSHKIVVNGVKTTITLDNVTIETNNQSAVDIGDDAEVELIVEGANSLTVTNSEDVAGIHVSGGSLTISGTDAAADILTVTNDGSRGATIGSDLNEDFTGTITIDGGVTVNAGNANTKYSYEGAGIGSGQAGDMSGTIEINEGSVVNAYSKSGGAGIGSGGKNCEMSGDIIINGGEVSADGSIAGAGIGTGYSSNLSGTIEINGGKVNAKVSEYGAGIGTGDFSNLDGAIIINGGDITAYGNGCGIGIGSGKFANVNGDITIHGNADIMLENGNIIGSYKEGEGTISLYKGAEINGITVQNVEDLKEVGILNDNMSVELLEEPKTDSGHSYSLSKSNSVSRIKAAKAGDTVYLYESQLSKGKVPYYVLEELGKTDDVTLVVVSDSGETVEIKSSNIPEKGRNAFFTVDELLEMEK